LFIDSQIPLLTSASLNIQLLSLITSRLFKADFRLFNTQKVLETITYEYNLQNRLVSVSDGTTTVTYKYNPDGIRVQADDGTTVTNYLIDTYNHTGYAQVFKETRDTCASGTSHKSRATSDERLIMMATARHDSWLIPLGL